MTRSLLAAVFRWRRWRIAAGAAGILGIVLVATPQFGVLGFEAALATALVVPVAAGALGAGLRRSGLLAVAGAGPWRALAALLVGAEILVAVPLLMVAANMVRAPVCDPLEGLAFFALLPAFSAALAASAGWTAALATRSSFQATLAWILLCLACLGVAGYRFFATPAVAFYGPFFGQFPGALYDTLVPVSSTLLTFRATNVLEAAAALAVVLFALDPPAVRLSASRLWRSRRAPFVVLPALGVAALAWLAGPSLGHRTSAGHVAEELGALRSGIACDVWAPRDTDPDELRLLVSDCDFRVHQIRRTLGLPGPGGRITVFAFASEAQKARLMGAGRTSIAKPWRREVYVHSAGFPHPVLKHELAHVILGELARGPFRVPARLGGLLPIPGLIEGSAVALEWAPDILTPHGWAAAMDWLDMLPSPDDLVGAGFLGEAAGLAYTAMGSFVRWLVDTRGTGAFSALYADGDFEAAYGAPLADLWREWRAFLAGVPLTPSQVDAAQARFDVPGFFTARCLHAVAALAATRDRLASEGDLRGAAAAQEKVCALSGGDPRQLAGLVATRIAAADTTGALDLAATLLDRKDLGRALRGAVESLRADAWWLEGRRTEALAEYRRLLAGLAEPADRRLTLVKIHGTSSPEADPFLLEYLLRPHTPDDAGVIDGLERFVRAAPSDPMAHYLLGRAETGRGLQVEAARDLGEALDLGLAPDEVRLEAARLLVTLQFRLGDLDSARTGARALAESGSERYRAEGADWLERIGWATSVSGTAATNVGGAGSRTPLPNR